MPLPSRPPSPRVPGSIGPSSVFPRAFVAVVAVLTGCSTSVVGPGADVARGCGADAGACGAAVARDATSVATDAAVVPPDAAVASPDTADASTDAGDALPDANPPTDTDVAARCVFAPRTAPIVLYYGTMRDEDGTMRDDLTFQLANPGLDVVFTIGGGSIFSRGEPTSPGDPGTGAFREYHEHCLRMAFHMGIAPVIACLAQRDDFVQGGDPVPNPCAPYRTAGSTGPEDLAALWQAKLDLGWDYIAIDEIKHLTLTTARGATRTIDLTNGQIDVQRFTRALDRLAAVNPDYDRRLVLFFAPHSADGPSAELPRYRDLFGACTDHCRTVMHELYLTTREVESGRSAVFENVAVALHGLGIPGINRVTTAIIAVGNDPTGTVPWEPFDHAVCDIAPWDPVNPALATLRCPALPGSGGVARQLAAMHAGAYSRYWWGVGFYKIGAVRSADGHWTKEDFVRSTAEQVSWWAHHAAP